MVFTPQSLMVTSVVVGAVAVATLALSVATDAWLFTLETTETTNINGSTHIKVVHAQMGLWKVCSNTAGKTNCTPYSEISRDSDREEGLQTSFAIMRATRVAAIFPVVSLVMITIAVILGILGNLRQDIKTLFAAIIAILAGLTLAVGIIFYISAINDEVGHRMKGKEGKTFKYSYGWSFFFAGIAFMIAEATAVVFVTQFMQRNSSKDDMVRIIPGLEEKFDDEKENEMDASGTTNPTIIL